MLLELLLDPMLTVHEAEAWGRLLDNASRTLDRDTRPPRPSPAGSVDCDTDD